MPGTLVFVRHGASEYNLKNIFTGWIDAPISDKGKEEAHKAAEELKSFVFDEAYTSKLSRAADTLRIILSDLGQGTISITENEALNERHYGDLQGHNKDDIRQEFGEEQVHIWRRSFDIAPPGGESLKDTCMRTVPYFEEQILPKVKEGKNIIVAAHGNSLRSILMDLDKLSPEEILKTNIATGVPYVYTFDDDMNVIDKKILHHTEKEESLETHAVQ